MYCFLFIIVHEVRSLVKGQNMNLYYKYNTPTCIYHMIWEDLLQIWHLEQKYPDFNLIFDDMNSNRWDPKKFPKLPDWLDWVKLVKETNIIKLSETTKKDFNYDLKFSNPMDIKYEVEPKARYPLSHSSQWHKVKTNYNLTDFSSTILKSLNIQRNSNPQNYIFVNRANGRRSILNGLEIVKELNNQGYPFIHHTLEDTDLSWQVKLFNDAKWVIAPEGAALTHMMFMQPKTKVTVIYPEQYTHHGFPQAFARYYDINYNSVQSKPFSSQCISDNHQYCFKQLRSQNPEITEEEYNSLFSLSDLKFDGNLVVGNLPQAVIHNQWLKNAIKNQNMIVDYKTIQ